MLILFFFAYGIAICAIVCYNEDEEVCLYEHMEQNAAARDLSQQRTAV